MRKVELGESCRPEEEHAHRPPGLRKKKALVCRRD